MNQQELLQLIDKAAIEGWTELDLRDRNLTALPSAIGKLTSLRELYLGKSGFGKPGNQLTTLPSEIGLLVNLEILDVSDNQIKSIPSEIGNLTSLVELDLSGNHLSVIPEEFGQLVKLSSLNIGVNRFESMPLTITRLVNLRSLRFYSRILGGERITKLPDDIGQLSNLEELEISGHDLLSIPPNIGLLSNLKSLDLSGNLLASLPQEIGLLSNLRELDLAINRLETIPQEIGDLINLTGLNLNGNQLTAIPAEIGRLINLKTLSLEGRGGVRCLLELPSQIGQLKNLVTLELRRNELTSLPPEIGQLINLNFLDLRENRLSFLPREIGRLESLTQLGLSGNQIKQCPSEIGQLIHLTGLGLEDNQLKTIPSEFGLLRKLSGLDLSNNQLNNLPPTLQQLTNLEYLNLSNNSALGISREVLEQVENPKLILETYFGKRRPLHEAKMLLVGQGGVGKTALARQLLHDLPPDSAQGKTEGVDIQKWAVTPAHAVDSITLNLWDFGGQGVYQATHQFFFTSRSLYLIVINARTGEKESRLRHWLKLVGSLSDNAPAIIVVNKQDQHSLALNERELKHKYPNLLAIIPTSCTTGAGIADLRQAIVEALAQLPHINDQFPIAWFDLKTQLEAMDGNYITYEAYQIYCANAGINSPADQRSWVQVLHQLGVVLNYQDDKYRHLEGTHVLKPEWVTDGVYRILSDPNGEINANNGILTAPMLDNILNLDDYPRHQQHFIVEMMRKFELSFRIPHRHEQYLIPDLLLDNQPELSAIGFAPEIAALHFQIHYTEFLPGSIISRFMVGMMASLDRRNSWRNGAVLTFDGNHALVRADLDVRKIYITVTGIEATRRSLLNSIRMQLHAIHNTFPNLPLTEHIPIPGHPDKTIAYHALCNLETRGIEKHYDPVNDVELDVVALLAGVETPALRRERQLQEILLTSNLEEIAQLCFDLKVEYEDLPGQTKTAKSRELVQLMGRHGRLDELEEKLKGRR